MGKNIRDIIITILIAVAVFFILQTTIGAFKVYGTSMLPNIYPADYVLVDKISYKFRQPERGEVIVLRSPQQYEKDLIKRVIAVSGDTIEIKNGKVYINDTAINEPYIKEEPKYSYPRQFVPEESYFVLGDNRNISADSHSGWLLTKKDVVGKAIIIYWPFDRMEIIKHYDLDL